MVEPAQAGAAAEVLHGMLNVRWKHQDGIEGKTKPGTSSPSLSPQSRSTCDFAEAGNGIQCGMMDRNGAGKRR